ncbi:hypothetical protein L198_00544 [Cryptococcus wingfieldii CBS 7118]|uniref:AAA+ ATPase domain-containing protein n=1 Tax=Cryptococcus wingfieldii CBS 7118 TaxID=1295528 RepID=A0A1E3K6W6_9TREE|nr:hypothetical protein L198_00544 [Cryptococcus wingfieldii CBS 7118]ODO08811.1 hypothetical protein L198_00544 [Cryptococcus wingfieldii CBS 7118]
MAPCPPPPSKASVHPFFSSTPQQSNRDPIPAQAKPANAAPKRKRALGAANASAGPAQATLGLSSNDGGRKSLVVDNKETQPTVVEAEASHAATEVSSSSDHEEDVVISHASQNDPDPSKSQTVSKRPRPKRARPSIPLSTQASSSSLASEIIDLSSDQEDDYESTPRAKAKAPHMLNSRPAIFSKGIARSFSRTGSTGTNPEAPIEVPEGSPSPVKMRNTSSKNTSSVADKGKPAHSFFTQVRSRTDHDSSSSQILDPVEPLSGRDGAPYEADNGFKHKKKENVHTFFSLQQGKSEWKLKDGWGTEEVETPLPQGPWPSHVGSSYSQSDGPMLPSRSRKPAPAEQGNFWGDIQSRVCRPCAPSIHRSEPINILPFILQHPAFSSLQLKASSSSANREAWVDRYRPKRATEVLGNELEATYLRDWLSKLAIGHRIQGPKIIRKVVKRPKAALVDDFIVDDLGVCGDAFDEDKEDEQIHLDDLEEPPIDSDITARPAEYPPLDMRLTNTILLTGKSGSGKSAAVHAAAQELGWEIFEVYPGMGRRTGGALMGWLGDLGQNHIVPQAERKPAPKKSKKGRGTEVKKSKAGGIKSFFDQNFRSKPTSSVPFSNDLTQETTDSDEDDPETKDDNVAASTESKYKQSLILIDEADILFEEEATFWPGVLALVSESRRPVVLTCNDHKRIPLAQLPLQAILQFHPLPSSIAMSYLQAISDAEGSRRGYRVTADAATVYKSAMRDKHETDIRGDGPALPNGHERVPYFDLRQAIGQLQLGLQADRIEEAGSAKECEDDLKTLFQRMEAQSCADVAGMKPWVSMDISDIDRLERTSDDELNVSLLQKSAPPETYPILALCDQSPAIVSTVVSMSGGGLPPMGDLGLARTKYIRSTLPVLDPLIPLSSPLLPSPSIFLHTLPAIITILLFDAMYEKIEKDAIERGEERINPKTGKPMRRQQGAVYGRYWDLGGAEEAVEEISRLWLDW